MSEKGPNPQKVSQADGEAVDKELGINQVKPAVEPVSPEPDLKPVIDVGEINPDKKATDKPKPVVDQQNRETRPEDIAQAELKKVINDFQAKQSQIAEMRAKKTSRFASLAKSLGIKTRNLDDDPEVMSLEKDGHDLYRDLISKGIRLYKGDKPQLENFLRQFDEYEVFKVGYNQEMDKRAEFAKWPETVLAGFQEIGKKWSELKTLQKIAISMAGGLTIGAGALALGMGTFGAAALSAGYRWGFRGFGAMAVGVGRRIQLDAKLMKKMESEQGAWIKEKLDILKKNEDNLDKGIEEILSRTGIDYGKKDYEQRSLENSRRARNLALKSLAISSVLGESFRYASQAAGINFGTILKKIGGYAGIGGGTGMQQANEALYTKSPDGKIMITPKGLEAVEGASPSTAPVELSPEDQAMLQKDPTVPEPEVKTGNIIEETAKSPATGAEVQAPEMEKPASVLIGENNVKSGGGIEKSAKAIIKANPREFGLDPDDSKLNAKAGQKAHILARGLAKKLGMPYEKLNEIASNKVQVSDEIRIYKDPTTGDFNLNYKGAAFNDAMSLNKGETPDISAPKSLPAEEAVLNKPKLSVEDVKPKASGEYQPQKVGPIVASMEEIEANYKQDLAQRNYARAVRAEQDWQVRRERMEALGKKNFELANIQQGMAIRGYIEHHILPHTSIGKNVSFWSGSALQWYEDMQNFENQIAPDVSQADATDLHNRKMGILKELFAKLGKPKVGQTNWEYLLEKTRDSQTAYLINKIIARE